MPKVSDKMLTLLFFDQRHPAECLKVAIRCWLCFF